MFKIIVMSLLISTASIGETTQVTAKPLFITVHMNQGRGIRINASLIRYYQEYYPYDDLYWKGEIFLIDGTRFPVTESPEDIDLMFQDEVSKPKNERTKAKN